MLKKLISTVLVFFMVLNLTPGFSVMADETSGGKTGSIPENVSVTEEISENDTGSITNINNIPTDILKESGVTEDTGDGGQEKAGETRAVQPDAELSKEFSIKASPASPETVEMRVWTPGQGRVLVNGSDYGTEFSGTWYKGTEVSVVAVPDSGYLVDHWWVTKADGSWQWVGTADNTLIAGTDTEAAAYFGLETAYLTITPPAAGTTAAQAPQVSFPGDAGYGLVSEASDGFSLQWVTGSNLYGRQVLDPGTTFEAGETYYAYVCLSDGNDSFAATAGGSTFNTDLQVTGGEKIAQSNSAVTEAGGGAYIWIQAIIAVTIPEADTHTVTFDMRGHYTEVASQKVADGEKAVKPASPVNYDKASDYDTTGLRFSRWNKYAPEDLTYDTFWNTGYPFRDPVTEDMTIYALYETVLSLQAYDITNDVWSVGGTITWDHIYHGSPQTRSNAQTTVIEGTRETLTANPNPGFKFVGWSSSKSKDDIEWTDSTYTFINEQRKTLYALFEEEAPLEDLTFDFQIANGAGMSLTDIVSSFTVNGEDWLLPVSGMQVSRQIAAGSTVVAVMNAGDNALLSDAALPDGLTIDDFMVASSEDGSGLTVAFTMPEDAVVIVVDAKRAVTINYDVNGGTKGPAWPGDLIKIPYTMGYIGSVIVVDVGNDLVNPETGEDVAIPPDGCRYAGLEVTDKNGAHTGALGQRITGLNFSEGATFKILWEKDTTVTVTFHANGGTPEPANQIIKAGVKASEPAAPHKEGGWSFGGWYTDEECEEAFNFDTAVEDDLDLYARWNGHFSVNTYDKTYDSTNAGGTFDYEIVERSGKGVHIYDSENIPELTTVKLTAHPAESYRFVGWAEDTKDGTIVSTDTSFEFIIDETPVTIFAVFEKTITIHWSSVDGVDLMDPIEIPFVSGNRIGDIMSAAGYSFYESPFEKDGYISLRRFCDKPATEFSSYTEMNAPYDGKIYASTVVTNSMDIYAIMMIAVDAAELTIEPPVCGVSTEVPEGGRGWKDQTNPPAVSVPGGENYDLRSVGGELPAVWALGYGSFYEGNFIGGEEYNALVALEPAFGYGFPTGKGWSFGGDLTVNGGDLLETSCSSSFLEIVVKVAAAHEPAEPVNENVAEPGCTDAGSHDEVVRCKECGAELSRTTVEDAALGHNWSAWEVSKEPTGTEDGEEKRTCARCKEIQTKVIPHYVFEYHFTKGDSSTWERESSNALEFIIDRSSDDEKAFSHFTGLKVDGKDLDAANYTAESGSVIIKLKPEYLGTLSAGKHTLTALFDDGEDPSAEFTIGEKKQPTEPAKPSDNINTVSPKTADNNNLLLWFMILCASLFALCISVSCLRRPGR